MSGDVYLFCYKNGEEHKFHRSFFEKILLNGAINTDLPLTRIEYPNGVSEVYGADEEDYISSLSFGHFSGSDFFDVLFELIRETKAVLLWPSSTGGMAATSPEIFQELPAGMHESEQIFIVANGEELEMAICNPDDFPGR